MKYAFVNNGVLQDVVMTHPSLLFALGYANQFIEVPDDCSNGWVFDGVNFSAPPDNSIENLITFIRLRRNELLKESDWTQVVDSPTDKAVWATYRQSLRDITKQSSFPSEVQWPIEPT
jgi:hypothetical protein